VRDRSVRSLAHLQRSASTARVLNLLSIATKHGHDPEHAEKPFFTHPRLNSAIIVKHRLRPNEHDLFPRFRQTATKVLVPIDREDLRYGGGYVFVGENNYATVMEEVFGACLQPGQHDWRMLEALDEIPSLDPFLLREQLRRHQLETARCYLEISDADLLKMLAFVEKEVLDLVSMSLAGGGDVGAGGHVSKLARKLLSDTIDEEMEPLRQTLRLDPSEFLEGVFCWKGFLYYKWSMNGIMPEVAEAAQQLRTVMARGSAAIETRAYLSEARPRLHAMIVQALRSVHTILKAYDDAYSGLTKRADPMAFRDFLLTAPPRFQDLGERLGAVQHIASFWKYRFTNSRAPVDAEELANVFMDFEECLSFVRRDEERGRAA
jgi:hypothetical protein